MDALEKLVQLEEMADRVRWDHTAQRRLRSRKGTLKNPGRTTCEAVDHASPAAEATQLFRERLFDELGADTVRALAANVRHDRAGLDRLHG